MQPAVCSMLSQLFVCAKVAQSRPGQNFSNRSQLFTKLVSEYIPETRLNKVIINIPDNSARCHSMSRLAWVLRILIFFVWRPIRIYQTRPFTGRVTTRCDRFQVREEKAAWRQSRVSWTLIYWNVYVFLSPSYLHSYTSVSTIEKNGARNLIMSLARDRKSIAEPPCWKYTALRLRGN